jgi:transcriptional regulator of acetoin/glycerol metabolism
MMTMSKQDPTPRLTAAIAAEPDLVDRIFDYLLEMAPEFGQQVKDLDEAKRAVRDEFGGVETYIRSGASRDVRSDLSRETAQKVLQLFNGRNATEVARRLQISRATVYRAIKTAGGR